MIRRKHKQYTKRIIAILFLIQLSLILNKQENHEFFEIEEEHLSMDKQAEHRKKQEMSFFGSQNVVVQVMDEIHKLKGFFDSNECLYDKNLSKEVLSKNGLSQKPVDDNLRFILGQCNPVIFIPGLYSTRLLLTINCKKFTENVDNLINLRLYCGESMCKNDYEEHVIWPALLDSPFKLHVDYQENRYSACFSYFFKFQKKQECPKLKTGKSDEFLSEAVEESICISDDAVKITFHGGTEKTVDKSQCGIGPVKNIVSVGSYPLKESWFNSGAARAFEDMYDRYYEMGYRPGFSIAGVPYDFRRFVATNELFKAIFTQQIEKLYKNTGKPVIIIAHSFGCVNTLNQLISENQELFKKIKKFIAVAPPFAGAPKNLEVFIHGSKEFDTKFSIKDYEIFNVELNEFGQKLVYPFVPALYELKPNPIIYKLFKDKKYEEMKKAFLERFNLEKHCNTNDCEQDFMKENSKLFNNLFNKLPSLMDKECNVASLLANEKFINLVNQFKANPEVVFPNFFPCRSNIYDNVSCPTLKFRKEDSETASSIEEKHCHEDKESIDLFNHLCYENLKNCLDKFFDDYYPYPYEDPKMFTLFDTFKKHYSQQFPDKPLNITTFFDSKDKIKRKIERMVEYQGEVSPFKDMNIPKVDTMIIYGSYLPTRTAYVFDTVKNKQEFYNTDILMKGGDGTVPSWSSLLVGLKWLYDKKIHNLKTSIQVVEYCSMLSKIKPEGKNYEYDPNDPNKEFMAVPCICQDSDGFYDFKKIQTSKCEHATMIGDPNLIKFVEYYLMDTKNIDFNEKMPGDKLQALSIYDGNFNYESACNLALKNLVDLGL